MIFVKHWATCHVIQDYYRTPNPKFHFDLMLFPWVSDNFACNPKIRPTLFYLTFLKVFSPEIFFRLFCLKAKNEEILAKKHVYYCLVKNKTNEKNFLVKKTFKKVR